MPNFFSGHSPNSHCVMKKKLRIDQAKFNVTKNRLLRFAHTFCIKKKIIEKKARTICITPGRPKFV